MITLIIKCLLQLRKQRRNNDEQNTKENINMFIDMLYISLRRRLYNNFLT